MAYFNKANYVENVSYDHPYADYEPANEGNDGKNQRNCGNHIDFKSLFNMEEGVWGFSAVWSVMFSGAAFGTDISGVPH